MNSRIWDHHKIAFGGDYNPEQWDESVWEEDMRLLKLAHVDTLTVNIFSWATLQPSEDVYDFSKLDKIMEMCRENGMKVVLATSTAAHPAWMARKYPDVLRVDVNGIKRKFGARHNSCPNSPTYLKYARLLAEKLAQRYGHYDNIIGWHISNEYGGECYCENCEKAFRLWLKERYGTLEAVNRAWNTAFWSHTFYDWDEIVVPDNRSEHWDTEHTNFQGISLDYRRFNSESILRSYCVERDAVKAITPHIPVTTNLMEFYKPLDYRMWAKEMDFASWDSYPRWDATPAQMALNHALIRGLKDGKPFVLMEQTPSVTNWQPINSLKRPGVMRLWSYQAVAQGSDSVMYFQMRRSIGACEKYHGAIIDHAGHENTRVFRETAALGAELDLLGDKLLGSRVSAQVGILFDWDNWWAVEYSAGPTCLLRYRDEVTNYYSALYDHNLTADIVGVDTDFSSYKLLIAPVLYMVKPGVAEKLRTFVKNGGTLVTTFFSGYVNETDIVTTGGYPGELRDILGIWVEEIDALPEGVVNPFAWEGKHYEAKMLCDLLHCETARPLAHYEADFYAGMPVLTENSLGQGKAYYVAARTDDAFYQDFLKKLCDDLGIQPVLDTPAGVEAVRRERFLFLLNHNAQPQSVTLDGAYTDLLEGKALAAGQTLTLEAKGVKILERQA